MISVKAAAIAQRPTGLEGLVVRAMHLSPFQNASSVGKKQSDTSGDHMWSRRFFYIYAGKPYSHTDTWSTHKKILQQRLIAGIADAKKTAGDFLSEHYLFGSPRV